MELLLEAQENVGGAVVPVVIYFVAGANSSAATMLAGFWVATQFNE